MKKTVKIITAVLMVAMLTVSLCSCLKIKNTVAGWLGSAEKAAKKIDTDDATGQNILAVDDGSTNRESRISGAKAKAANTQMEYNKNRTLDGGLDVQPEGTKYVVEANGYYVEFTVEGGNLVDTNPEELPSKDPYKNNKSYKKATKYIDNIRKDCTIYLPKGEN